MTEKMRVVVHPATSCFKRPGFLGRYGLADFDKDEFYEKKIPDGKSFLHLVHSDKYVKKIQKACSVRAEMAEMRLSPECFDVASIGVGTTVFASDNHAFAVQNMAGHHAGMDFAMGFNLFNSSAIAAQRLVNQGKRVCIIDIDGHHGNGTQSIFYSTDQVLFCSIHQRGSFPGTGEESETGKGRGRDYTFNIPVLAGSGDDVFLNALERVVERAKWFKPEVVGVYAGFDGYYADKLLDLNYSLHGFYRCGKMIGENFENVFADLGGGYHKDLAKCVFAFVRGINRG